MAIDYLVRWADIDRSDDFMKAPDTKVIGEVLEDYFSGLYMDLTEHRPGYFVLLLKGIKSSMFVRHGGRLRPWDVNEERYIEVFVWNYGIDVTVRMPDDVTLGLAKDFAHRCAQRWDGTVDDPS